MTDLLAGSDPARPAGYRIVSLTAENIKRIEVVEIRPAGDVVELTGRNRQGKTSVLDAMWWTLGGTRNMQTEPIRRGAEKGFCELDLGDIIVRRNISKGDAGITTSLTVRTREGAEYRRPQATIDTFFNTLSLDPQHFLRMETAERFSLLRQFVPDVDFEEIEKANAADYAARRDLNVQARQAKAVADRIAIADEASLPAVAIDIDALSAELEQTVAANGMIETRRARREGVQQGIDQAKARLFELELQVEALRVQIAACEETRRTVQGHIDEATKLLADAPSLPEPTDIEPLRVGINEARRVNGLIEEVRRKGEHIAEAKRISEEAEALTKVMADRLRDADEKIAGATMPVPGLSLKVDGTVSLNGFPLEQASDAEQLRTSIELAVALNPKLRVIRVRDGSLLDDEAMQLIREMAHERDFQVWIERVTNDGGGGFELVAGRIRQREAAPA